MVVYTETEVSKVLNTNAITDAHYTFNLGIINNAGHSMNVNGIVYY